MEKKFKYAIIRNDKTIKVLTPNPYIVNSYKESEIEELIEIAYGLDQHCKFLYDCLNALKISKKKAIENDFTLNQATGDKLRDIAWKKEISYEMVKAITNHDW